MSEADREAVTTSAEGITVRKAVDTEQFQTLAVVIEVTSTRDDAARVQLIDAIPSAVSMDDVGFHPKFGAEFWTKEDDAVIFLQDLDPGETVKTVYGIRDYPADDIDALLGDPRVVLLDVGPESIEDLVDERRSEVVRNFLTGEAELPGLDAEPVRMEAVDEPAPSDISEPDSPSVEAVDEPAPSDTAEPDSPSVEAADEPAEVTDDAVTAAATADAVAEAAGVDGETSPAESGDATDAADIDEGIEAGPAGADDIELDDETAKAGPADAAAPTADQDEIDVETAPSGQETTEMADQLAGQPTETGQREVRVPLTGGVVRVLIKELREGDIDPEDRRLLRDELAGDVGDDGETDGRTQARLAHLQQRVSDLEAFATALESFIDEEGNPQQVLTDLRDDLAGVQEAADDLDERLDETNRDVSDLGAGLDSLTEEVEDEVTRRQRLADRVIDTEDNVDLVAADVDDVASRVDELAQGVDAIDEHVAAVEERLGDVDGKADAASERIDAVDARVEDLSGTVESFEDEFDSLRKELHEEVGALGDELRTNADAIEEDLQAEVESVREDHRSDLETLRSDLGKHVDGIEDELREEVESLRDDLQGGIDALRSDLEDFAAFRDRLSSALGAAGGAGAVDDESTDEE